jgi:hypothetical protein
MSKPKTPAPAAPPQPDAPAAKAIFGAEDTPADAVKKRNTNRNNLRAAFLTAPTPGVGIQL